MNDGLTLSLVDLRAETDRQQAVAQAGLDSARETSDRLDDIDARVQHLLAETGVEADARRRPNLLRRVELPESNVALSTLPSLAEIHRGAEERLRSRGIDPETVRLDDLLPAETVERLERRYRGGFTLTADLDRYDVIAAVAAGVTAAIVDATIVRIPKEMTYLGERIQKGSPLTEWLHSQKDSSQHWLAKAGKALEKTCKVSFDRVGDVAETIEGFGGRTHRLQTLGHDPLVGLVVGTIDVMRGGLTAISRDGMPVYLSDLGPGTYNPLEAFVRTVGHILSDFPTAMGVQPPGFTLLQTLNVGSFGEKDRTVGELARFMYLKGYDSRHFLTMSTSVAAAETVARGYFALRRRLDGAYDEEVQRQAEVAGAEKVGEHPRFQAITLTAHAVAAAANAGKVAVYAGNPLAINYAQWLRFTHATWQFTKTKLRSPSDVLIGTGLANARDLDGMAFADLVADPDFPTFRF